MGRWRDTLHPERFQGRGRRPPWFEGWYYKLVDAAGRQRLAVIPGVFLGADPASRHAFVQVLDGTTGRARYHRYPAQEFEAAPDRLEVRVGKSRFGTSSLELDLGEGEGRLRGAVHFSAFQPWPVRLHAPGIMGWYAWVPFMECYHGVVSLDHALDGGLELGGQRVDWSGGRGYVEKDWGRAFPSAYVWMQTNHFGEPGISLTASIAMIPWIRRAFRGFIVGLWHQGRLHRFATYTGARTETLEIADGHVLWSLRDRRLRLELRATRAPGAPLVGPSRTEMHRRVDETLTSSVEVRLSDRAGRTLFAGTGRNAGLEVHGDLARLLAEG